MLKSIHVSNSHHCFSLIKADSKGWSFLWSQKFSLNELKNFACHALKNTLKKIGSNLHYIRENSFLRHFVYWYSFNRHSTNDYVGDLNIYFRLRLGTFDKNKMSTVLSNVLILLRVMFIKIEQAVDKHKTKYDQINWISKHL
jgi:hypothetical protein